MPSQPPDSMNEILPLTPDVRAERLAELKRLFPDLFTNEGRLNPDELRQLVEPNEVHETERYEFKWYGKAASKREAFTPTTATLVYDQARSVNPDKADGNMIIEGENLETLKLLLNAYREQVKCIYIDPPYNTGKDFIYSDRFADGQKPYWEQTGVTEDGIKLETNTDSDGRFHSNWLSMMHSRLLVARSLLRTDGVIFVSIDDNEVVNLRRVMDDVYGAECRLAELVWKNKYNAGALTKGFSSVHEYILCYSKAEITNLTQPLSKEDIEQYRGRDAKFATRGGYVTQPLATSSKDPRPNLVYPITIGGKEVMPDKQWIWERSKIEAAIANDEVVVNETDGKVSVRVKQYLKDEQGNIREKKPLSLLIGPFNQEGSKETDKLLGSGVFTFPKPSALIKQLISLTINDTKDKGGIHLDFFGGSGTTAQAVMELNKADGGNRQFILVQLPEQTDINSPAHKEGLNKISDITIERAKRVITREQRIAADLLPNDQKRQFAESLGFKVYKLQKSNFPRCEFKPDPALDEAENATALRHYIEEKEAAFFLTLDPKGEQAVFDEVLLKNGFQLHYTRTRRDDFTENTVYEVRDPRRSALVCLAWNENIHDGTIKRLRELSETGEAPFFICLERSLTTTSKWNLKHFLGNHFNAF
jgi:adenine-specific DNA-methyltransferase